MPSLLRAHDLSVDLGPRRVLDRLAFTVDTGDVIALVGPNGAGKTTLLRAIAGLLPHGGQLDLGGQPVRGWDARARAREVALVRQQTALAVEFTAAEVVALGRAPHLSWTERLGTKDRDRVQAALDAVDLGPLADRPVTRLSGGEQQRVALAQALAQDAGLLLLDEPTAHLDVRHQLDLLDRLAALTGEGRTVIAAVHDLGLAARFADRLWVLDKGRLVADGSPEDVLTPELLREVFGVEADITQGLDGVRVRYLAVVR